METKQSSLNQNLTKTGVHPQQSDSNNSRLFVIIVISVLLTAMITGSAVYFWQRSKSGKTVNSLEQEITSLKGQLSKTKDSKITAQPILSPILSPSPPGDLTANWKTYINTAYNYSVKYPENWFIATQHGADPATYGAPYLESPCDYDGGDRCVQIGIVVLPPDVAKPSNPTSENPEDYYSFNFSNPWPDKIITKKETIIDGSQGVEIEYFKGNYFYGGQEDRGIVLIDTKTLHNNLLYSISFSEVGRDRKLIKTSDDWQHKKLMYQIISTFRFTD